MTTGNNSQDTSPRVELIGIQKRLLKRIKQSLYAEYCQTNPWIDAYYEDYKKLTAAYEQTVSRAELLDRVSGSDIVYIGDYHTLRQAQKTVIRILEPLITSQWCASPQGCRMTAPNGDEGRPIILGLEMLRAEHQPFIDRFMSGEMEEAEFLKQIDYEKTWGFNWNHYKTILTFARTHNIRVYGLNTPDMIGKHALARRDRLAAKRIAEVIADQPGTLMVILFGDLHIAENHLPRAVDEALSARQMPQRNSLIICQNSERIYWKLAESGLEQTTEAVKIKDGVYCIINSTPLMVFQSCLNWQYQDKELKSCAEHPAWCEGDSASGRENVLMDEMTDLVRGICDFLNLDVPPLDRFSICSTHDFDIIEKVKDKISIPQEKARIELDLARTESYFIREANLICLSNLSINHAAEEAAHLIHYHYALTDKSGKPSKITRTPVDDFYYNIIREALGFFGSRIINHKRLCAKEPDFRDFLKRYARKKVLPQWVRDEKEIAQAVLEHVKLERDYIDRGKWKAYKKIHYLRLDYWVGVSQSLGYILGDKLYSGVTQGIISRSELRELFLKPFTDEDEPLKSYLYLLSRVKDVKEIFGGKEEHL